MKFRNNHEIAKALLGPIIPVGETNEDSRRLENLKETIVLVGNLIDDLRNASTYEDRHQASMVKIARTAKSFLSEIVDDLREFGVDEH